MRNKSPKHEYIERNYFYNDTNFTSRLKSIRTKGNLLFTSTTTHIYRSAFHVVL